ncbi:MAG: hypothetical protein M0Q15_04855 [Nevskia sp.]|jgi:hypothetical protein|nr:hypothetical protein [Nevskia sp.]
MTDLRGWWLAAERRCTMLEVSKSLGGEGAALRGRSNGSCAKVSVQNSVGLLAQPLF